MKRLFCCLLLVLSFSYSDSLDELLDLFSQEEDLSKYTKLKNAGVLTVFTRNDLDRLHISTLKDLVKILPLVHYKKNYYGYGFTFFSPYQSGFEALVKFYLDDQEILFPNFASKEGIFQNINLSFVNHVEFYMGLSSIDFGLDSSQLVVKLYSKKPDRENTNVVSAAISNKHSYKGHFYTTYSEKDFSYLLNISTTDLKTKLNDENTNLQTKSENYHLFSKFKYINHELILSFIKGDERYNPTLRINTQLENEYNLKYFNTSYAYYKDALKFYISHTSSDSKNNKFYRQSGVSIYKEKQKAKESATNLSLIKNIEFDKFSLMLGLKSRYKTFKIDPSSSLNAKTFFDKELTNSLSGETLYYVNDKNSISSLLKYDNIVRNKSAKDDNLITAGLGYGYKNDNKFFKFHGVYSQIPSFYHNYKVLHESKQKNKITNNDTLFSLTGEVGLTGDIFNTSLLVLRSYYKKSPYTYVKEDMEKMDINEKEDILIYGYYLKYDLKIDTANKIKGHLWYATLDWENTPFYEHYFKYAGGFISLFSTYDKFDFTNNLSFKGGDLLDGLKYSYDFIINYNLNKDLSFFMKGENIFSSKLDNHYTFFQHFDKLGFVPNICDDDRKIWLGFQYYF